MCPRATKIPIDPKNGKAGKSNDPGTWGTFEQAKALYEKNATVAGVGYVYQQQQTAIHQINQSAMERCSDVIGHDKCFDFD